MPSSIEWTDETWNPKHLRKNRDEYLRLVSDYFGGLSRHSRNQIINAIKNPNDVFWAQLGHPFLVLDAPGNPWQFMEHEPPESGQVAEDLTERPAYLSLAQNQFCCF